MSNILKKQFSDDLLEVRTTKVLDEKKWNEIINDLKNKKIFDYYCLYIYVMCDFLLQRHRFDDVSILLSDLEKTGSVNNGLPQAYFYLISGHYHWYKSNDHDIVMKCASEVIELNEKLGLKDNILLFAAHQQLGVAFFINCEYYKAYENFFIAMKTSLPDFFKYRKAMTYSWLGRLEEEFHNPKTAIWNYTKCAEILKKFSLHTAHADILNTIGCLYFDMKRNEEAFLIFKESLEISQFYSITFTATDTYINLGLYYNEVKDFEKATECYLKSIEMRQPDEFTQKYITNMFLIGKNYLDYAQLDLAGKWLADALEKALDYKNDTFLISQIYGYLGVLFQKQNDFNNALKYFKLAEKVVKNNQLTKHSLWICTLFEKYYEQRKQYKKAMEVLQKYKNISLQIEDEMMNQSFEFIQFKARLENMFKFY